jgi:undecaprenyl-phosphate 4-deoxy-4-formamido-L-arabinose transferase
MDTVIENSKKSMAPNPKVSIVIPMLNEEPNVPTLLTRLYAVLEKLPEPCEVVCVDDGSTDKTLELLKQEQTRRPNLVLVSFLHNFGQHTAVMAGFEASRGDWIITMDADLQNPPEEIPRLVEQFRLGHDLVGTIRQNRQDPLFRKVASAIVTFSMKRMCGISLTDYGCMLRGYSRAIAKAVASNPEYKTYIPALGALYAGNPVEIPITHAPREKGQSKYSLFKLFVLLLDIMTGFSVWPLRFLFFLGFVCALVGILFGFSLLGLRLYYGSTWAAQGVFTLFAILFIFIGAQFWAFGLLGEYIGRIYQEVRRRPYYLVKEHIPPKDH